METTYTTLKNSYNLGNQYVQDCYNLIESEIGQKLMFGNISQTNAEVTLETTLIHEDFFKQLDPTNKAFRKYQELNIDFKINLETLAFGRGMRKNMDKFTRIGC